MELYIHGGGCANVSLEGRAVHARGGEAAPNIEHQAVGLPFVPLFLIDFLGLLLIFRSSKKHCSGFLTYLSLSVFLEIAYQWVGCSIYAFHLIL
ncbi:hypothetical protein F4804DRAFT_188054 [Jackrogersella minutella]|nr:hypothetical protein F4804DRAFT_188054 [Jackrogersella minutella]